MHKRIIVLLSICICMMLTACKSGQAVFVSGDSVSDSYEDDSLKGNTSDASYSTGDAYGSENGSASRQEEIAVYVCGAVADPGVYFLEDGSIKKDALDAAGGFKDGASECYVNLAEAVCDGEKIYVPYEKELESSYAPLSDDFQDDGRININTATAEMLMTLPGIGQSKADAIIKYREQHGAFNSIEDIKNISGIKDGVYNNIKELIVAN